LCVPLDYPILWRRWSSKDKVVFEPSFTCQLGYCWTWAFNTRFTSFTLASTSQRYPNLSNFYVSVPSERALSFFYRIYIFTLPVVLCFYFILHFFTYVKNNTTRPIFIRDVYLGHGTVSPHRGSERAPSLLLSALSRHPPLGWMIFRASPRQKALQGAQ